MFDTDKLVCKILLEEQFFLLFSLEGMFYLTDEKQAHRLALVLMNRRVTRVARAYF